MRNDGDTEAGFTLLEVLLALLIVAVSLAPLGALVGATVRNSRAIEDRVVLVETARTVLAGMPERSQIIGRNQSGMLADFRWTIMVRPFGAVQGGADVPTRWTPYEVAVEVQSPRGSRLQINTIRLLQSADHDAR